MYVMIFAESTFLPHEFCLRVKKWFVLTDKLQFYQKYFFAFPRIKLISGTMQKSWKTKWNKKFKFDFKYNFTINFHIFVVNFWQWYKIVLVVGVFAFELVLLWVLGYGMVNRSTAPLDIKSST